MNVIILTQSSGISLMNLFEDQKWSQFDGYIK